LLMAEGDAGGGDAFAVGFYALRAYRPLFAAFQLYVWFVSIDMMSCQTSLRAPTFRCLQVRLSWKVSRLNINFSPTEDTHHPVLDLGGILLCHC
jgi:hypothetical protein